MKTAPRRHQQIEYDQCRDEKARALLWYMRSGKSKAMIDLACYLRTEKGLHNVIVVAPNGVHQVWETEQLPTHHWDEIPYNTVVIDSAKVGQKRWDERTAARVEAQPFLWVTLIKEALNVSRVRKLLYDTIAARGKTLLIVDEVQHFGRTSSQRSENIQALAARCEYKRILTGSEADDGLENLFGQFQILRPGALGWGSYEAFEKRYCKTISIKTKNRNGFVMVKPKIVGYQRVKELQAKVASWSSRVTRKDADLPPLVPMTRQFDLPPKIARAYARTLQDGVVPKETVPAIKGDLHADGLQGLNRLGQISSGFLYDSDGNAHEFDRNPRLDILADLLETMPADEQVIIWCAYGHEVRQVNKLLGGFNDGVSTYFGGMTPKERELHMSRFKMGNAHTLVGTPHSGGEGLELGCASSVIWFSHVTSNRLRKQASERASSSGDKVALIDLVANCKSDKFLVKAYRDKTKISKLVQGKTLMDVLQ